MGLGAGQAESSTWGAPLCEHVTPTGAHALEGGTCPSVGRARAQSLSAPEAEDVVCAAARCPGPRPPRILDILDPIFQGAPPSRARRQGSGPLLVISSRRWGGPSRRGPGHVAENSSPSAIRWGLCPGARGLVAPGPRGGGPGGSGPGTRTPRGGLAARGLRRAAGVGGPGPGPAHWGRCSLRREQPRDGGCGVAPCMCTRAPWLPS